MKVMLVDKDWGTENLKPVERPDPKPGPGEALLRMEAVSINPRDLIMVKGGYGRVGGGLPLVPLCDGSGTIVGFGPGGEEKAQSLGMKEGDLVCPAYSRTWMTGLYSKESSKGAHGGPLDGTAQEYFTIPVEALVKAPSHMTPEEAATLPCAAVTAWNAVVDQGAIGNGGSILLQGTGGVSLFALQIAKMKGATTYLISSSDEKLARASALGADHCINYRTTPDWHKTILQMTDGRGVDQVVDIGGAETLNKATACTRHSGTISLIGVLGGNTVELGLGRVVTRNLRLQGVTVGSRESFAAMAQAFEEASLKPVLDDQRFEFEDLPAALESLPSGRHFGKRVCRLT